MLNCLLVGLGGFIGSVMRYLIGLIPVSENTVFPIKTFCINVIGAFAIGCIVFSVDKGANIHPGLVLMLKVGVCGGFTTFSTFALETSDLIRNGSAFIAASYCVLSIVLGIAAIFAAKAIVG